LRSRGLINIFMSLTQSDNQMKSSKYKTLNSNTKALEGNNRRKLYSRSNYRDEEFHTVQHPPNSNKGSEEW